MSTDNKKKKVIKKAKATTKDKKSKEKVKFGAVELAFIILSLAVAGLSYQMEVRQRNLTKLAKSEAKVGVIFSLLRGSLIGENCRTNLAGLGKENLEEDLKFLKVEVPKGPEVTAENLIVRHGYVGQEFEGLGSKSGVTVEKYGLEKVARKDHKYLFHMHFKVGEQAFLKQLPIYAVATSEGIQDCSLRPLIDEEGAWTTKGRELQLERGTISLGVKESISPLTVKGGVYASRPLGGCEESNMGTLFFNKDLKVWGLCTRNGFLDLVDKRRVQ